MLISIDGFWGNNKKIVAGLHEQKIYLKTNKKYKYKIKSSFLARFLKIAVAVNVFKKPYNWIIDKMQH